MKHTMDMQSRDRSVTKGVLVALAIIVVGYLASAARATTVGDLTRMQGEGEVVVRGIGLVMGLSGTGDAGKDLIVARPLFAALTNEGDQPADMKELVSSKSVALVMVTAVVRSGAKKDDRVTVTVSAVNNPKSLAGGHLYLAPLRGPTASNAGIFALAEGPVELESPTMPNKGRVVGGARMLVDVKGPAIEESFDLILDHAFAGYQAAAHVAESINVAVQPQGPGVAKVVDDRTIRVSIPEHERQDKAGFLAAVQSADVNTQFLGTGAKVVYNASRGIIIVTADVEIGPTAITQKDLSIVTTTPPPTPTPQVPIVETQSWAQVKTKSRPSQNAKLSDLVAAFKQLNVPVGEQIAILQALHRAGSLHAELIEDNR